MDCCGHPPGQYGAGAGSWDYGPYAPLPYASYAHYYPPHHDPYRYYRYDYPAHHSHHNDHVMSMDYGSYASKEARVRRALARRDARAHTPSHHLPHPHTPPLECGMNSRPAYCEPQMWPHYQMGLGGGWGGANAVSGGWMGRNACSREHMRYPADCRPVKVSHMPPQNQVCHPEGRSTPYPVYEDTRYNGESTVRQQNTPELPATGPVPVEASRTARDCFYPEPRRSPPEEKRPPVVPLPAFQQAFGSTEIGKFAEAFSRTEIALEDASNENFSFESFPEWDGSTEPQWSTQPASREIKCEDSY
ncbi:uncharacterized protein LOC113236524 isoform X1 [Hyposmocoma kahamanoa]|uniref:uncharacterized protein LOC113236524 isoform X1 n=1 Tax=Hyposmocoma kahamanoa TaxID=1477025 RepID=UPI000E6D5EBE|nr:uncharacterized protein LOC113236524 isoform X1 [Hyposmocoma kahamanoa]XP_026328419.1 uncharacterized protein LOC113236524 isoform X1 [Hyposmocoma kahamanoa]